MTSKDAVIKLVVLLLVLEVSDKSVSRNH
jgi:hypothetical protein